NEAREREEEDANLNRAQFFYRGVLERVDLSGLSAHESPDSWHGPDHPIVTIKLTRLLWGDGAQTRLDVPWVHLVQCPMPNIVAAYWASEENEVPPLRPGWGVTVIGRAEDWPDAMHRIFILIDGEQDTARIVQRFQTLRLGWRQ
ncbi:hypothetical protein LTR94_027753, partial [Friedmanniomyces endolithicus]